LLIADNFLYIILKGVFAVTDKDLAIYNNLKIQIDKLYRHINQLSINSRPAYKSAFLRLCKHVAKEFKVQNIRNINDKHVYSYISDKIDDACTASYLKSEMSGIRFIYDQIGDARYRLKTNNDELGIPERDNIKDRTWTDSEVKNMLKIALVEKRYDVYFSIALSKALGTRLHECFRMTHPMARKALKQGFLRIKGKGGLIRNIPLTDQARNVLRQFISYKGRGNSRILNDGDKKTHLCMAAVQRFIAKHRSTDGTITHHGLRHTYAVDLYNRQLEYYLSRGLSTDKAKARAFQDVNVALGHGKDRKDVTRRYLCSVL
jgi:site-specific recombinase XerD